MGYKDRWEREWYSNLSIGEQHLYDYVYEHSDSDGIWEVIGRRVEECLGRSIDGEVLKRAYQGRIIPSKDGKLWYIEERGEGNRVVIAEASESGIRRQKRVSRRLGYSIGELKEELAKYRIGDSWLRLSIDINLDTEKTNLAIFSSADTKKPMIEKEISETVLSNVFKDVLEDYSGDSKKVSTVDVSKGVLQRQEKEAILLKYIGREESIVKILKRLIIENKRKRKTEKEREGKSDQNLVIETLQEKEGRAIDIVHSSEREAYKAEGKGFAKWFSTLLPKNRKVSNNDLIGWAGVYVKLREMGKTKAEIVAVTKWARQDRFWEKNFLSARKLIKKNAEGVYYYDVFLAHKNALPASGRVQKELPPAKSEKLHIISEEKKKKMLKVLGGDKRKA